MSTTELHAGQDIATLLAPRSKSGTRRRGIWMLALALIAGTVGLGRMLRTSQPTAASTYLTETVKRGDLAVRVSATGKLQPTNTVEIGSELSGLVDAVFVDDNDSVRKGQVLARLDTLKLRDQLTRSQAALASAEAQLAQAAATVQESRANLERLREVSRLSGGRVPSKTEMEAAEAVMARADAQQRSAVAAVTEARAAVSSNQTDFSKASIRSPVDGIVLKRSVEPGQTVAASLQVATLFTIAEDLRKMELEVDVDEADVGRVAAGQQATFTVDAYPDRTYEAAVQRVAFGSTTTGDVVSYGTVLVVSNDDLSLRPGMTASAEIATATVTNALLVPNGALRFTMPATQTGGGLAGGLIPGPPRPPAGKEGSTDGTHTIWVLRNGSPAALKVKVGQTDGRQTEIASGELREGDAVITEANSGASS